MVSPSEGKGAPKIYRFYVDYLVKKISTACYVEIKI